MCTFTNNQAKALTSIKIHQADVMANWLANDGGLTMAGVDEVSCCEAATRRVREAACSADIDNALIELVPAAY